MTWFSYDLESGMTFHETKAAAQAAAEADLDAECDRAHEGWSDEVGAICWGWVLGQVVEAERRPWREEDGGDFGLDEFVDYRLIDTEDPTEDPTEIAAKWNRRWPLGTPVRYWPGAREGTGVASRTLSRATAALGDHTPVVWVEEYPACVALSHVEPVVP